MLSSVSSSRVKDRVWQIGLIGFGAIGSQIFDTFQLPEYCRKFRIAHVLIRDLDKYKDVFLSNGKGNPTEAGQQAPPAFGNDFDAFLAKKDEMDLIIEVAGQPAVRSYAKQILECGQIDLMLTSIGALTDEKLHGELVNVAEEKGSLLLLCSGSMPGLDWMGAACCQEG